MIAAEHLQNAQSISKRQEGCTQGGLGIANENLRRLFAVGKEDHHHKQSKAKVKESVVQISGQPIR